MGSVAGVQVKEVPEGSGAVQGEWGRGDGKIGIIMYNERLRALTLCCKPLRRLRKWFLKVPSLNSPSEINH